MTRTLPSLCATRSIWFLLLLFLTGECLAQPATSIERVLASRVEALLAAHPNVPGVAVVVLDGEGKTVAAEAAGVSASGSTAASAFTVDTPLRIASNTKTYVAATVLRLSETGRLDLDATLAASIDTSLVMLLEQGGYDPAQITLRQVLAHSAGLFDHAASEQYLARVLAEPTKQWTREEQVAFGMEVGAPVGVPGAQFRYSDTGYIILGHLIERVTGNALAAAVRAELGLDGLGLAHTWWEIHEPRPEAAAERAHQYIDGLDTYDFHASLDLYGGGGIVASVRDLAAFNAALFRGDVFEHDTTLEEMMTGPGAADPMRYRYGLQRSVPAGQEALGHSGFWGTLVFYVPALDVTVAGAVTEQEGFGALWQLMVGVVAQMNDTGGASED